MSRIHYDAFHQWSDFQMNVHTCIFVFQSVKALEEWKKHLLRSVNKDRARSDVIEKLSDGDVLIERD